MRLVFIVSILSLLTAGCGPLSPAYYQPTEPTYKYLKKAGATELDVKKAMLECGMADVDLSSGNFKQDMNSFFLAKKCLEELGYKSTVLSMEESCKLEHNVKYPACQPDAVIPKPSVERRLNSKYCQSARDMISEDSYQRCMQVEAADPLYSTTAEDCAYEYKELREECRP